MSTVEKRQTVLANCLFVVTIEYRTARRGRMPLVAPLPANGVTRMMLVYSTTVPTGSMLIASCPKLVG